MGWLKLKWKPTEELVLSLPNGDEVVIHWAFQRNKFGKGFYYAIHAPKAVAVSRRKLEQEKERAA